MNGVWPPAPTDRPDPPPAPDPPGGGRDVLVAACLALGLLPVNLALVYCVPQHGQLPNWWPYAFAAALGGLIMSWMYGFLGGLLYCRSRDARLALAVSLGGPGFALMVHQVARLLGHGF